MSDGGSVFYFIINKGPMLSMACHKMELFRSSKPIHTTCSTPHISLLQVNYSGFSFSPTVWERPDKVSIGKRI